MFAETKVIKTETNIKLDTEEAKLLGQITGFYLNHLAVARESIGENCRREQLATSLKDFLPK